MSLRAAPDVFSIGELARATGASVAEIAAWVEAGAIRTLPVGDGVTWITRAEAIRAGRAIRAGTLALSLPPLRAEGPRFELRPADAPPLLRTPLALSSSLHVAAVAVVVLATTLGIGRASATSPTIEVTAEPMRLVYLALPGPGGGGGGGGDRRGLAPPRAKREGGSEVSSPAPVRRPPESPPREPEPEPLPQVETPVVLLPGDEVDQDGVIDEPSAPPEPVRGPGDEGGTGSGIGGGMGEGEGTGVGPGSGGGEGGGPYRPGSGIAPPRLLREVRPDYTDAARRRGIEGEVLMEIVVRRDGSVGDVRIIRGLGHGLDERAVTAVRQWRFEPATRHGVPVDVLVEVTMEFRIR
ncbi:MAG TPA: energy transducer TonB [Paracoccaceae bacterium]|nr:energy transducer TonB [Paracoccaceae bacterium]